MPADTFARDHLPPREEWPDLLLGDLRYPARLNAAVELLEGAQMGRGDRPAFIGAGRTLTYAELAALVDGLCHALVEDLGLVSGNRILIRALNSPLHAAVWLAVVKAGGIAVSTMPLLRRGELETMAAAAQVGLAVADEQLTDDLVGVCERIVTLPQLEHLAARHQRPFPGCDTAADDVALIAFTSGTTGRPKGTVHFHRDVLAICDTFSREIVQPTADDVFIGSPPLAFTFGLGGLLTFPLRVGAASVLLEQGAPDGMLDAIAEHGATVCFTAPTAYRRMLALGLGDRVRTLRRCVSAGETLPRTVFDAWEAATGLRLIDGIGATEMLHVFISAADDDIRPGTTGRAVPGYEARVVDDEMRDVPPGVVGRLAVRGPTGCRYLADPRQREYVRDGWNLTGDAYLVDEDGYFHYQARLDDMIVTGGYNVAGPEVEAVLVEHEAVLECAVVAAPDDDRGNIVKAFVVVRPEHRASPDLVRELQDFVKARIAPYKYPRAVEFIDALPRTETGKVRRYALRERG